MFRFPYLLLLIALSSQEPLQRVSGIASSPQGLGILAAEDARAPTPQHLSVLLSGAAASDVEVQRAAIRALGRLERRDLVVSLLPHLLNSGATVRSETAVAIAQAMRGERLPLDTGGAQVEGVLSALSGAAVNE